MYIMTLSFTKNPKILILFVLLVTLAAAIYLLLPDNFNKKQNSTMQQVIIEPVDEVNGFNRIGQIEIIKFYNSPQDEKPKPGHIFALLEIKITPDNLPVDLNDVELKGIQEKFSGQPQAIYKLDDSHLLVFEIPKDLTSAEVYYGDKNYGKAKLEILFKPPPSLKLTPTGDSSVSVRASPEPSKPPIFSTTVALGRSSSAVPEQAQGRMDIQVTDVVPNSSGLEGYKTVIYKYRIVLENMEGDKEYWVSFCEQAEGSCSEFVLVRTDSSGSVSLSGERSKSYDINRPYWYIKVTQADSSGPCYSPYSPCLRGNFSLSL